MLAGTVWNRPLRYGLALLGPIAVTSACILLRRHFNDTTGALLMVLLVLLAAVRWGSGPALLASVCGALLFSFYFLPQGGRPDLWNSENWVALGAFLITAATAGELSARERRRAAEAEAGREEARLASAHNRNLARLRAAFAELGESALRSERPDDVMQHAAALVAATLETECCGILQLLPDGKELLLRFGTGWHAGVIGVARIANTLDTQAGCPLAWPVLQDHGLVSGICVAIPTTAGPYGVLCAYTTHTRTFADDEVRFLESVANVLGMTVQRNQAEEGLRQTGINLRRAQEIAHVGSWHLDLTHNRLTWSDEVFRIFDVPPGTRLTYEAFIQMVHPDDRLMIQDAWQQSLHGAPYDIEHRIIAGGGLKWVRERARVEFGPDGAPREADGTVQDITERKRAEAEIRALNSDLEQRVAARTAELERAREREVELGFKIQQTLLLEPPPGDFPGLQIAALTIPSQRIDGDFYIFIPYHSEFLDVVVGDVMGKGSPAALLGAATKSHFLKAVSHLLACSQACRLPEPKDVVMAAHAELARHLIELDSFVTLCYARLDMQRRRLDLVDCGHTGTIHWSHRTGLCRVLHGENLPLGVREGEVYTQISTPFEDGDLLLFYSDGITEARTAAGEFFGIDRLEECIRNYASLDPKALTELVRATIGAWAGRPGDDLTVVAIRVCETPVARAETELRSDLSRLQEARQFVRRFCEQIPGTPLDQEDVGKLVLAVNEAASNIIRHAHRGCSDEVIQFEGEVFPGRVSIRLHYCGEPFEPPPPRLPEPAEMGQSGFGLYLMSASVDEVRHYREAGGRNCVSLTKVRPPR